jgi:hypothetical protein
MKIISSVITFFLLLGRLVKALWRQITRKPPKLTNPKFYCFVCNKKIPPANVRKYATIPGKGAAVTGAQYEGFLKTEYEITCHGETTIESMTVVRELVKVGTNVCFEPGYQVPPILNPKALDTKLPVKINLPPADRIAKIREAHERYLQENGADVLIASPKETFVKLFPSSVDAAIKAELATPVIKRKRGPAKKRVTKKS